MSAYSQNVQKIGPFEPGMTFQEAMASADVKWEPTHYKSTRVVIGAVAYDAVSYGDAVWTVQVGSKYPDIRAHDVSFIKLSRTFMYEKKAECQKAHYDMITKLEGQFGAFGLRPDFKSKTSPLYGDPYSEGFKVKKVSKISRTRIYPDDSSIQFFTSFREPRKNEYFRIMVHATRMGPKGYRPIKSCDLELTVFIPHEYHEGEFIIPPALEAKYPGRYW